MSKIKLYCIPKKNYEGDYTEFIFRKNDIIIIDNKDIMSLTYDFEPNDISEDEKKYLFEASMDCFEKIFSDITVDYENNEKLEIIENIHIENYNCETGSEISVNKIIYKVNDKHILIIDKGDINTMTTITNVFNQ